MLLPIALLVLDVFGLLTNILSLIVLLTEKKLKTVTNYYQSSLSLCNVVSIALSAWIHPAHLLSVQVTKIVFLRAMATFGQKCMCIVLALNILAQGFERYVGLSRPFKSRTAANRNRTIRIIIVTWIAAAAGSLPDAFCESVDHRIRCGLLKSKLLFITSNNGSAMSEKVSNATFGSTYPYISNIPNTGVSNFCDYYSKITPIIDLICFYCIPVILNTTLFVGIIRQLRRNVSKEMPKIIPKHGNSSRLSNSVLPTFSSSKKRKPVSRNIPLESTINAGSTSNYNKEHSLARIRRHGIVGNSYAPRTKQIKRTTSEKNLPRISIALASNGSCKRKVSRKDSTEIYSLSTPNILKSSLSAISSTGSFSGMSTLSLNSCSFVNIEQHHGGLQKLLSDRVISYKRRQRSLSINSPPISLSKELTSKKRRATVIVGHLQKVRADSRAKFSENAMKESSRPSSPSQFSSSLSLRNNLASFSRSLSNRCYIAVLPNTDFEIRDQRSYRRSDAKCFSERKERMPRESACSSRRSSSVKRQVTPTWLWRCRMKAIKNLALIIVSFVVEWLPYYVIRIQQAVMCPCDFHDRLGMDEGATNSTFHVVLGFQVAFIAIFIPVLHCVCSHRFFQAYVELLRRIASALTCNTLGRLRRAARRQK
ncbi:uncharacterized protein LOC143459442 isoform X1 [Clavelina lepadiformis]|uniref:uncharacterized protein LOC143459442 isoform X1 n=1 Tax=Clavelina lepadiformis TaxID=159417 RepID=UPI0040424A2E